MIAVKRGHMELVRYLLQYSVVKSNVPMVNKVCHLVLQATLLTERGRVWSHCKHQVVTTVKSCMTNETHALHKSHSLLE